MSENLKPDDVLKIFVDYLKHLTSLSTGSILLVATFRDKFFKQPEDAVWAAAAVIFFLICVLASTVNYTLIGGQVYV